MSSDSAASSDEIEELSVKNLIYAIKSRPGIWQLKHPHHNNIRETTKLWQEVQKKFPKFTVVTLKKKWKNVKDQFRKEIKKYPLRPNAEPGTYYTSTWVYFDDMVFLAGELAARKPYDFIINNDPLVSSTPEVKKKKSIPEVVDLQNEDSISDGASANEDVEPELSQEASVPLQAKRKRPETTLKQDFFQLEKKKIKLLEKNLQAKSSPEFKNTDDYHFFMSLIPQMASMPIMTKLRIRSKMLQAIIEESDST